MDTYAHNYLELQEQAPAFAEFDRVLVIAGPNAGSQAVVSSVLPTGHVVLELDDCRIISEPSSNLQSECAA